MAEELNLTSTSSVLVIAAHPDDVKNCTGVVLRTLDIEAPVALVQVTNGENYGGSKTKQDALPMGAKRKDELLRFLAEIGVADDRVFLMGIPNSSAYMLEALRNDFYEPDALPFPDPVLGSNCVIYEDAYKPGMQFFGESLVDALVEVLERTRPSVVMTHHPKDDHRDHRATAFFARTAVAKAVEAGGLTARPDLLAMLVYYRPMPWPPSGDRFLTPEVRDHPFGFDVVVFDLTDDERDRKRRACQTFVPTLPRAYINSYMKADEVFWRI